jgi:hypothetical protein
MTSRRSVPPAEEPKKSTRSRANAASPAKKRTPTTKPPAAVDVPPAPDVVQPGSVLEDVRSFVETLDLDPYRRALAQVAFSLARFLDGDGGDEDRRSIATVAKELKATLEQLLPPEGDDDGDDWVDDAGSTTGAAKVRDAKKSGKADAGSAVRQGGRVVRSDAAPVAATRGRRRSGGG